MLGVKDIMVGVFLRVVVLDGQREGESGRFRGNWGKETDHRQVVNTLLIQCYKYLSNLLVDCADDSDWSGNNGSTQELVALNLFD